MLFNLGAQRLAGYFDDDRVLGIKDDDNPVFSIKSLLDEYQPSLRCEVREKLVAAAGKFDFLTGVVVQFGLLIFSAL